MKTKLQMNIGTIDINLGIPEVIVGLSLTKGIKKQIVDNN